MGYRLFSVSLPGSKYKEKNWPCQDNSIFKEWQSGGRNVYYAAVADGHGGSKYFRSEIGSAEAVETVLNILNQRVKPNDEAYEDTEDTPETQVTFNEGIIAGLKFSIITEWKKNVKNHWDMEMNKSGGVYDGEIRFTDVNDKYKARYCPKDGQADEKYIYSAYGTTLLMALALDSLLLLAQVGDGTCVVTQRDGEFRIPVPPDENNQLNITSSLCEDDVFPNKFRHTVIDCAADTPTEPVAVFLSTDGLDDCYPVYENEQYLYKLYTVIIENILKYGYDATEAEITKELLPSMTSKGSQDDISLAYLICDDLDVLREAYNNIDESLKNREER